MGHICPFVGVFPKNALAHFGYIVQIKGFIDIRNFGGVVESDIDIVADNDDAYLFV